MKAYNKKQVYCLGKVVQSFWLQHLFSYVNEFSYIGWVQASGANAAEEDESEKSMSEVNDDEDGDEGSEEVSFLKEFS